jgi:hypothetical protein
MLIGVGLLEILILVFFLVFLLATGDLPLEEVLRFQFALGIILLLPFGFMGYAIPARRVPVEVRCYSPVDGTVEVCFTSAQFEEKFVAAIRAWEKKIQ